MKDDDDRRELAEVEEQLRVKRKKLAIVGLVFVGAVLAWRFSLLVDRTGDSDDRPKFDEVLEVEVTSAGQVRIRGCGGTVEHCVATAKVRQRNEGTGDRAILRVAPGSPAATVAEVRALLESYELAITVR